MRIGITSGQLSSACSTSSRIPTAYCAHGNACAGALTWSSAKRLTAAHTRSQGTRSRRPITTLAGIKAVDTYDGKFDLTKESEGTLTALLSSEVFCKQVVKETQQPDGTQVEYTGILFQPVPWSPTTKKGMPQEFEKYHADPDYVMINIPPNFMFKAKVFKPSRLCAIYRKL
ncbi:hypothetical protein COCOBI_06-0070 [Coccomyxa sp. Obi]|nr:hypothetical protein COCOBI_06-0070 [Coccomyxa sp. Obi]